MQSNYSDPTVAALFAGGARVILRSRVSTPRIVNVPVGESSLVTARPRREDQRHRGL